jgi:hypothetical protein
MKKPVLIILLLASLTSKSQTSVYHPFPDSNAVWNFNYDLYCFLDGNSTIENYSIALSGDTVINSQAYHKLNTPFVKTVTTSTCGTGTSTGYKGAVRHDMTNKKVFYISPTDTVEQLLYDFNLQTGDTIMGFLKSFSFPSDTVESIDSVLVGIDYRKRWKVNSFYPFYIIEGIGSTYGLVELYPGVTDLPYYSLICFQQNGQTLYPDTTTSCEVILDIKNIPENKLSVSVSPNPFHNSATFILNSELVTENAELRIFNAFGESVQQIKINGSAIIHRNSLADGIYFYQLFNEKKDEIFANGKFVIE